MEEQKNNLQRTIVAIAICIIIGFALGRLSAYRTSSENRQCTSIINKTITSYEVKGTCVIDKAELYKHKPMPMELQCREEVFDCSGTACECLKG